MDHENLRQKLLQALVTVAPEAVGETLDDQMSLQDQLDLDSVDMLNFVLRIQKDFKLAIPNSEYSQFFTLHKGIQELEKLLAKA